MVLVLAIYMSYFECLYYLFLNVKIRYKMQTGFLFKIGASFANKSCWHQSPDQCIIYLIFQHWHWGVMDACQILLELAHQMW